jgi:dTDP-glucose pyrophosphorylase
MKDFIKKISISKNESILSAIQQMDIVDRKLLITTNENGSFFSLISIGDIQRAIIKNIPLETSIHNVVRHDITIAHVQDDMEQVKLRMKTRRNEYMPIVDEHNNIIDVILWENLFEEKRAKKQIDLPVVIMAGGKGSRLKPLTNIIPKPLIPINDKTIIEDIMDRFVEFGCNPFYISVNYKANMIRYYFETLANPAYQINFFQEEKPLGTGGSLSLLKGRIDKTFFVSNCDILIDQDYSEILNYHYENSNEITIVAALKNYPIPYGTIKSGDNGQLIELIEKPDLNFKINSGMYILEPAILDQIPENTFFHITDLIENIRKRNGKVGVFPVSEKAWKDMGSITEYKFKPE